VRTSALHEDLIYPYPSSSAHVAFRHYLEDAGVVYGSASDVQAAAAERGKKRRRNRRHRNLSDLEIAETEPSAADEMPIVIQLAQNDVANIQSSWTLIEPILLKVGVQVFLVLFETQPNMKRTFRQYRGKKHSELRINEDLQQLIMYLMSILKKIIKHISDTKTIVKYLRRLAKKHSPLEVDLGRFDPQDLATVFCTAIRELLLPPRKDQDQKSGVTLLKPGPGPGPGPGSGPGSESWSSEVEGSWASLFSAVLGAMRILVAPVKKDASCGDSGSDDDYGRGDDDAADGGVASDCSTSSSSIMPPVTSFDRHLVLIGCQTFQAFFDRHPQFLSNFDKFNAIEIDGVLVSSALKMHTSRVLAVVEDIVENTGNPEKIRNLLQELGRHHYKQGITLEHLEMLGPLICHTIRPLVFRAGLWTIELEKSWNHLFEMIALLMKRGYPLNGGGQTCTCPPDVNNLSSASSGGIFPSLTHTLILKDTWAVIVEQMHELGLPTFVKLFRLSANLRYYYPKHNRPESTEVQENINTHFDQLVAVVDDVVRCLPDLSTHIQYLRNLGAVHCDVEVQPRLLELMGPVFCNTVRPLLLVQGRWSYQVEMAWLLLFRHIAGFMRNGYNSVVTGPMIRHTANCATSTSSRMSN